MGDQRQDAHSRERNAKEQEGHKRPRVRAGARDDQVDDDREGHCVHRTARGAPHEGEEAAQRDHNSPPTGPDQHDSGQAQRDELSEAVGVAEDPDQLAPRKDLLVHCDDRTGGGALNAVAGEGNADQQAGHDRDSDDVPQNLQPGDPRPQHPDRDGQHRHQLVDVLRALLGVLVTDHEVGPGQQEDDQGKAAAAGRAPPEQRDDPQAKPDRQVEQAALSRTCEPGVRRLLTTDRGVVPLGERECLDQPRDQEPGANQQDQRRFEPTACRVGYADSTCTRRRWHRRVQVLSALRSTSVADP